MEIVSERELLIKMKNGDRRSFTALYRKNFKILYRYVYSIMGNRQDTLDIIQDVYVKVWETRERFQLDQSFTGFLLVIAKNRTLNSFRDQRVKLKWEEYANYSNEEKIEITDHKLILAQYYRIAQEGINQLPPKRQQIFKLSTEGGMSLQEIADLLKISKNVVRKQLYTATAFLREYLKARGCIPFFISLLVSLFNR